jgi:hypothetical protein
MGWQLFTTGRDVLAPRLAVSRTETSKLRRRELMLWSTPTESLHSNDLLQKGRYRGLFSEKEADYFQPFRYAPPFRRSSG